jgi:hypothetical protein
MMTIPTSAEGGSLCNTLRAFELLGLTHLIGEAGHYTAFEVADQDVHTFHVIPGQFSTDEYLDMVGLLVSAPIVDRKALIEWEEDEWALAA